MDDPTTKRFRGPAILVAVLIGLTILRFAMIPNEPTKTVSYTEMINDARSGKLERIEFGSEQIRARTKADDGKKAENLVADRIPNTDDHAVIDDLVQKGVVVEGRVDKQSFWGPLLWSVLPFLVIPLVFWGISAALQRRQGTRPMSFGKSKAKVYDRSAENSVTFDDVAGVDEAKNELLEVVSFLKEPQKYRDVGARVPKGVLLVGPPGTGKTLLARAVAGESGAPFFTMSGSEFVEMFVGVGASRVRDLFVQAKERAPCIIFIDELDAVGKTRAGSTGFAVNEEREQTLNQLLVEMDGFDSGVGLVIIAATNRPEILDRALLRAGRFDRQVLVDRPDVRGREAILKVHVRKIKIGPDVDLKVIAQRTPGMVGADLANVVNEAALASVRRGADHADAQDFEEAIDRIQLGLKKEGRVMTEEEKRRVAAHEAGHALVALSVKHADPVHRVTIIPRSIGSLGATLQLPTEERYLLTREELKDRISVLLGGRSAEEVSFGEISTGAQDDFERATELARQMVCRFGMSDELGPLTYGRQNAGRWLGYLDGEEKTYSDETARTIDAEIRSLVSTEHDRARRILRDKKGILERITKELIEKETLTREDLEALAKSDGDGRKPADEVYTSDLP